MEALWSEGGELRGPDGKAAFASPAGVAALTLYKTMMDEGLTEAEPANCSREELRTLFRQGRLAMLIADQFLISEIAAQAPGLTYGVAPPPKGTRQATYAVTDSAVLFKTSKSKAAAWKFLDFLFTKQPRLEFTSTEGFLPTTKAVAADRFIAKNERLRTFVKLLSDARFTPAVAGWDDAAREVAEAVRWVYLDKTQPAAALTAAAARVDDILAK